MSVLTTYEHKEMVWEAKAKKLIQVNKNRTKAKNKVTWHEKKHKGHTQLRKISVPIDMGNGSTQPRCKAHMIPQNEAKGTTPIMYPKLTSCRLLEWRQKGSTPSVEQEQNHQSTTQQTKGAPPTWMHTSPEQVHASLPWTRATQLWPVRSVPHIGQTDDHSTAKAAYRSDWCPVPVRPVTTQKMSCLKNCPEMHENPLNVCSNVFHAQTSSPCWQCMNQGISTKNLTTSFSNTKWALQNATNEIMSKKDRS